MRVSAPITVVAILALGVAGAAWLEPPQREAPQITVTLSPSTYQKLALWGKQYTDENGRPLTVAQVIEEFADIYELDREPLEEQL